MGLPVFSSVSEHHAPRENKLEGATEWSQRPGLLPKGHMDLRCLAVGWNLSFIEQYLPLYQEAAGVTIRIAFWGILLALAVGILCSLIQYLHIPVLRAAVGGYIELSRNTPLLVQLFFLYFGLPKAGLVWSAETCAIVGLGFLGGSYMAESLRGGLEAVEPIQMEAAQSLGMGRLLAIKEVVLPQALGMAMPGIGANVIFLIKETSVVSGIALADLMYVTKDLIGLYYETEEALLMLVVSYLVILLPVSLGTGLLERRLRYDGFGH